MDPIEPVPIEQIRAARRRIAGTALRTPLVRLQVDDAPAEIFLKLENLQPIGSFKIRGAGNAMSIAGERGCAAGILTASAGNMAQGVAWNARRLGVPCSVVVPDHAPRAKLDAVERLGATVIRVPFDEWWRRDCSSTRSAIRTSSRATARSVWRSWRIYPTWTR